MNEEGGLNIKMIILSVIGAWALVCTFLLGVFGWTVLYETHINKAGVCFKPSYQTDEQFAQNMQKQVEDMKKNKK